MSFIIMTVQIMVRMEHLLSQEVIAVGNLPTYLKITGGDLRICIISQM